MLQLDRWPEDSAVVSANTPWVNPRPGNRRDSTQRLFALTNFYSWLTTAMVLDVRWEGLVPPRAITPILTVAGHETTREPS